MKAMRSHEVRSEEVKRLAIRLRTTVSTAILAVAVLGCGNQHDDHPLALDTDYKTSVKTFAETQLYDGKSEDEVLSDVRDRNMHYLYVAFIEMFPTNSHVSEFRERLKRFQLLESPGPDELHVSVRELCDEYGLRNAQDVRIYHWGKELGFMMVGGGGKQVWRGPICLNNLQLLDGGFYAAGDGFNLLPGTRIIYPTAE